MSALFVLSNIAIPFLVLSYVTLIRVHQNGRVQTAKWLVLILYTLLSNFLFYLMPNNKIFLLLDLIFKLGIVFLPEIINQTLQALLSSLHLETILNLIRSLVIQQFFIVHSFLIQLVIRWMNDEQQKQFKLALINSLQRQRPTPKQQLSTSILKQYKQLENVGVSCDILTLGMINDERRHKQLLKLQLSQSKLQSSRAQLTHYGSTQNLNKKQSKVRQSDIRQKKIEPLPQYISSGMKKKQTFSIEKSNTDIGIYDDQQRSSPIQIQKKSVKAGSQMRYKSPQQRVMASSRQRQQSEPSMILNKLDVSQYSDMFEQEPEAEGRKLVAKVETIIQIAGISSARLQIYNIQLYSNSQIRIVSLYGRQFEKHRLVSMKPANHGYYQFKLEGGKVHTRKVKFRGSFQPFLKYLQPEK